MLITVKQAAEILGLSPSQVRRHCEGQTSTPLPAQKIAGVWLIEAEALEKFAQRPRKSGPKKKEMKMTGKDRIKNALKTIMDAGDANACDVFKGHGYGGSMSAYGWWYVPFNSTPVYLGQSIPEALDTIEDIAAGRETA
jgi:hypothetical protein